MSDSAARQRKAAHKRRKANIAAKRPVVETWQMRRDREASERLQMRRRIEARQAMPDLALLDAMFGEPRRPPRIPTPHEAISIAINELFTLRTTDGKP